MKNINKVICQDCGIEYDKNQYYLSHIEGQERMEVCKYCFAKEFISSESIEYIFRKYNIPFITELWEQINDKYQGSNVLPQYMKALWLPQFINLRWKDTDWNKEDSQEAEVNFYDGIVKNLKKEAVKLNDKLAKIRESLSSINSSQSSQSRSNDMNLYISTLKSLRDTLDLISKYDWKLMYSEYETDSGCAIKKPLVKQVSVWEQNHDNQIKNHKIWNVVDALDVAVKQTKDAGNSIGESLKSVSKVADQVPMYIDCVRTDDGKLAYKVLIYFENSLTILEYDEYGEYHNIKDFANTIHNMAGEKGCEIYIDIRGYGLSMYDLLIEYKDIKVNKLIINKDR